MHARYRMFSLAITMLLMLCNVERASQSASQTDASAPPTETAIAGRATDSQGRAVEDAGATPHRMTHGEEPPLLRVMGTVRDEAGNPLSGVRIEVTPVGRAAVLTDADGKFTVSWYAGLAGPGVTTFILVARDPARNLAEIVEVNEQTDRLDLTLKPGVIFTGTVLNGEGRPLAGARVQILVRGRSRSVPLGLVGEVVADKNGMFEIKAIPSGRRCVVTATAAGYGSGNLSVNASNRKGSRQDIGQLKLALANLSISGVVVDAHNKPVAGANIFTAGGDLRTGTDIRTDADGKFVIKGVTSDTILVIASTRGTAPKHGSVWAKGGATDVKVVVSE
jgi:protocatechuate 3,4-dioxygenase beta subunit